MPRRNSHFAITMVENQVREGGQIVFGTNPFLYGYNIAQYWEERLPGRNDWQAETRLPFASSLKPLDECLIRKHERTRTA